MSGIFRHEGKRLEADGIRQIDTSKQGLRVQRLAFLNWKLPRRYMYKNISRLNKKGSRGMKPIVAVVLFPVASDVAHEASVNTHPTSDAFRVPNGNLLGNHDAS